MKDVIIRAAKTFVQAAIGYLCTINLVGINWQDKTVTAGVILAAISAGISALMNIDWNTLASGVGKGKEE